MPISAAQSDATAPDPRRKGRVELLAADPTDERVEPIRQLTGDQPTATEDDISDAVTEATAIGANGSLADSVERALDARSRPFSSGSHNWRRLRPRRAP